MLSEFPTIHTNIWDAVWAVPVTFAAVLAAKWLFRVKPAALSTVATGVALFLSIVISHPKNLSAGIFMGFFYSGAAMGTLYSLQQTILAYRSK
ncbi:hypothetical protein [Sporosarcina trichiuri]|uniref:hypothetical protein n=1 Tax=Sporosarcina trichiuri TaxID=3056445 RepID=UPI0025B43564|nr:hypothetical protein [Sporosarcina sp. 0.2-SM1T-5]WJY26886.1 hypothetical protein QWT68_12635 [Sporosarcina sp. 0.2-SM1T-5]